jgi:hypothetical protein
MLRGRGPGNTLACTLVTIACRTCLWVLAGKLVRARARTLTQCVRLRAAGVGAPRRAQPRAAQAAGAPVVQAARARHHLPAVQAPALLRTAQTALVTHCACCEDPGC